MSYRWALTSAICAAQEWMRIVLEENDFDSDLDDLAKLEIEDEEKSNSGFHAKAAAVKLNLHCQAITAPDKPRLLVCHTRYQISSKRQLANLRMRWTKKMPKLAPQFECEE